MLDVAVHRMEIHAGVIAAEMAISADTMGIDAVQPSSTEATLEADVFNIEIVLVPVRVFFTAPLMKTCEEIPDFIVREDLLGSYDMIHGEINTTFTETAQRIAVTVVSWLRTVFIEVLLYRSSGVVVISVA